MKISGSRTPLTLAQKKQILWLTVIAVGLFVVLRWVPGAVAPERPGQFLAAAGATDERVELCDVSNIGFSLVNDRVSPVRLNAEALSPPEPGREVEVLLSVETRGGKPVTFEDILETHEEKIHLLIVDPSLEDYHHVHPQPADVDGEYRFSFTPGAGGDYRIFADFVSARTGRPVYSVTSLEVPGELREPVNEERKRVEAGDYRFELLATGEGYRPGRPQELRLRVRHREEGREVLLEPIMGEYAHLVGFDPARSGFTHMHPLRAGTDYALDREAPEIGFMLQVREAGFYKVWAQFKVDGEEVFVPFGVRVGA